MKAHDGAQRKRELKGGTPVRKHEGFNEKVIRRKPILYEDGKDECKADGKKQSTVPLKIDGHTLSMAKKSSRAARAWTPSLFYFLRQS